MQAVTPVPSHQARSGFLLFWPFSSFRVETSDGLIASCLIDGSMLWMNGSVAKAFRSTDLAGRDSMKRASVTYICNSSFTSFFEPSMILWTMPSLKPGTG